MQALTSRNNCCSTVRAAAGGGIAAEPAMSRLRLAAKVELATCMHSVIVVAPEQPRTVMIHVPCSAAAACRAVIGSGASAASPAAAGSAGAREPDETHGGRKLSVTWHCTAQLCESIGLEGFADSGYLRAHTRQNRKPNVLGSAVV